MSKAEEAAEARGEEHLRTVKIALVLYGGVSLAIYENGVTRAFYDLVKGRGVFGPLLALLDSDAEVDVIAGTSAGGINGLILAAALESGQDFAESAKIWRELGDFGTLLRQVNSPGTGESLLDGEGYYQSKLIEGFKKFCQPLACRKAEDPECPCPACSPYPGEIDLFVTGTELAGTITRFEDDSGNRLDDKTHRALFRLKHRPGRRWLGLPNDPAGSGDQSRKPAELQAHIFAALSRITSSFPAAFPPFAVRQLPEAWRDEVLRALNRAADRQQDYEGEAGAEGFDPFDSSIPPGHKPPYEPDTRFVDGGVLDNKPFGPALNAIFYRMPSGVVDRRLFFVEPDPVPAEFPSAADRKRIAERQSRPAQVALSALTTIPSHESIGGDLDQLKRHNAKIRYLLSVQERLLAPRTPGEGAKGVEERPEAELREGDQVYCATRVESLARLLAGAGDDSPSAAVQPTELWRLDLMKTAIGRPRQPGVDSEVEPALTLGAFRLLNIDRFDVDYLRRLAFDLLYHYYALLQRKLNADASDDGGLREVPLRALIKSLGRQIEMIEIVRAGLDHGREAAFKRHRARLFELYYRKDGEGGRQAEIQALWGDLMESFARFLDAEGAQWKGLKRELASLVGRIPRDRGEAAREAAPAIAASEVWQPGEEFVPAATAAPRGDKPLTELLEQRTILEDILETLDGCAERACDGRLAPGPDGLRRTAEAARQDRALFPLTFTSGVHELDRIEFVRVSPADAQIGLSRKNAHEKISGDELAHFAAFMRRDWRSNDILWGRLDGICQIVDSLLDEEAVTRLLRRDLEAETVWRQGLTPGQQQGLLEAWKKLQAVWPERAQKPLKAREAQRAFKELLIRAGQEQAVAEDGLTVFEDSHRQDIDFDRITGAQEQSDTRVTSRANDGAKDALARELAAGAAAESSAAERFVAAGLGSQKVKGYVPDRVIAEYATRSYLIFWDMLGNSLGKSASLLTGRARAFLRHPIYFLNRLIGLARNETPLAVLLLTATAALLAGGMVVFFLLGHPWLGVACLIGAVVLFWVFARQDSGSAAGLGRLRGESEMRRGYYIAMAAGLLATGIIVVGTIYLDRSHKPHPACQLVLAFTDQVTCERKGPGD